MRIAVLGSGPAGLMAAHAVTRQGHDVMIYSKEERSRMGGAQYLHRPIPGVVSEQRAAISYMKMGSARGYARKVYGDADQATSWFSYREGEHVGYSLREIYNKLHQLYSRWIVTMEVQHEDVAKLCKEYDQVFSTVPAERLCCNWSAHKFLLQRIVLVPQTALRADNTVLYSGRPEDPWYRSSVIFGNPWTEFSLNNLHRPITVEGTVRGIKPLRTNCDCHLEHDNYVRLGRYGRWEKGILTHHAYEQAEAVLTGEAKVLS